MTAHSIVSALTEDEDDFDAKSIVPYTTVRDNTYKYHEIWKVYSGNDTIGSVIRNERGAWMVRPTSDFHHAFTRSLEQSTPVQFYRQSSCLSLNTVTTRRIAPARVCYSAIRPLHSRVELAKATAVDFDIVQEPCISFSFSSYLHLCLSPAHCDCEDKHPESDAC